MTTSTLKKGTVWVDDRGTRYLAGTHGGSARLYSDDGAMVTPPLSGIRPLVVTDPLHAPVMKTATPLTLVDLLQHLRGVPQDTTVPFSDSWSSYRGYYEHISFDPEGSCTAGQLLTSIRMAIGQTMYGWKGGQYLVHEGCHVFIAPSGSTGPQLGIMDGELLLIQEVWH